MTSIHIYLFLGLKGLFPFMFNKAFEWMLRRQSTCAGVPTAGICTLGRRFRVISNPALALDVFADDGMGFV